MPGHAKDQCFCLHGYPEWHKLYGKSKPKPRHASRSGIGYKKGVAALISNSDNNVSSNSTSIPDVASQNTFTVAQCEQIAQMIQSSRKAAHGKLPSTHWAIVSSSHISGILPDSSWMVNHTFSVSTLHSSYIASNLLPKF